MAMEKGGGFLGAPGGVPRGPGGGFHRKGGTMPGADSGGVLFPNGLLLPPAGQRIAGELRMVLDVLLVQQIDVSFL